MRKTFLALQMLILVMLLSACLGGGKSSKNSPTLVTPVENGVYDKTGKLIATFNKEFIGKEVGSFVGNPPNTNEDGIVVNALAVCTSKNYCSTLSYDGYWLTHQVTQLSQDYVFIHPVSGRNTFAIGVFAGNDKNNLVYKFTQSADFSNPPPSGTGLNVYRQMPRPISIGVNIKSYPSTTYTNQLLDGNTLSTWEGIGLAYPLSQNTDSYPTPIYVYRRINNTNQWQEAKQTGLQNTNKPAWASQ